MKKTIILILAVLPIFLLVTIAFAGRILALIQHISVTEVQFVDVLGNYYDPLDKDLYLEVEKGTTQQTQIKIIPEFATVQTVTYITADENICTIDENGTVTGTGVGWTQVTVVTKDGNHTNTLKIRVHEDDVKGIELDPSEMNLIIGESHVFTPVILSPHALNKTIWYESSDPTIVKVDASGKATALAEGTATITATTDDGAFTATCVINAVKGKPAIAFDTAKLIEDGILEKYNAIYLVADTYDGNMIDLMQYIVVDEERVNKADVKIKVVASASLVTSTAEDHANGRIAFNTAKKGIITLTAYIEKDGVATYPQEIKIQTTLQ